MGVEPCKAAQPQAMAWGYLSKGLPQQAAKLCPYMGILDPMVSKSGKAGLLNNSEYYAMESLLVESYIITCAPVSL